jgi:uncharacterized protein YegP (UPF0339 family)
MTRIEIFSRGVIRKRFYFRIRATNTQIVAQSQGYSRKIDCIQSVAHLRGTLIEAPLSIWTRAGRKSSDA